MTARRINAPLHWRRPGRAMTRADYARLSRPELERRLEAARDRETRAETIEDALADAFAIQEISAAMEESKHVQDRD